MMLHQDGSRHGWIPAFDRALDLIITLDDATNEIYSAFLVKAGTPALVIGRLNDAINKALITDKVRTALGELGTDPGGGTPEDFGATVRANMAHWAKVVKDAGLKINQ
jgi:tripartite-type tricarboxylate transporter receptor subunit TctC